MSKRYFGTDGIRGQANSFPMTPAIAMRVGMAAGMSFQRGTHRHRGKRTARSHQVNRTIDAHRLQTRFETTQVSGHDRLNVGVGAGR